MAFKNAQSSRVLLGALNYSGYATNVSFDLTQDALEVTTIIDTAKKYIVGATQASYSIDVNLDTDTTAGGLWSNATTFKTTAVTAVVRTVGPHHRLRGVARRCVGVDVLVAVNQ